MYSNRNVYLSGRQSSKTVRDTVHITKTSSCNVKPLISHFYIVNMDIMCSYFALKHRLLVLFKYGGVYVCPQSIF